MIAILSNSALATVQDQGRLGSLRYGVGTSGAMDPLALLAANLMLGNDENAAAIEVPVFPFQVKFTADCAFAISGADCAAKLDDTPLLPWSVYQARADQVLRLAPPQSIAGPATLRSSRAYLALAGGIDVPVVLESRATQMRGNFGGHEGRPLQRGDCLRALEPGIGTRPVGFGIVPPAVAMPLQVDGVNAIRVLPAAQYENFTEASRTAFWTTPWKITAQSDRYGYRLAGENIVPIAPMEILSHGIVPGVIQVPHGGQPIIQMRDAQPSGGYPKFGTVIDADMWRLGQAPIGSQIRFIETSWDAAVAALAQLQDWRASVQRLIELQRWSYGRA